MYSTYFVNLFFFKIDENEKKIAELIEAKSKEIELKEKLTEEKAALEANVSELKAKLDELTLRYRNLNEEKLNEGEAYQAEVEHLKHKIRELKENQKGLELVNQSLRMDVEGLNKEKAFIISQNENAQAKAMQDYLALQEKYTDVNFKLNKATKDSQQYEMWVKEKEEVLTSLDRERNNLSVSLRQESKEKLDTLDKLKQIETLLTRVGFEFAVENSS